MPLVAEMVSDAFPGNRVVLTDKPFRSIAMGAAICAMDRVTYREVFARHFGIIRLRDHGQAETFDTIFPAGTPIPRTGEPPLCDPAAKVCRLACDPNLPDPCPAPKTCVKLVDTAANVTVGYGCS